MNTVLQNVEETGLGYNFVLNIFLNLRNLYTSVCLVLVICFILTIQKQAGRKLYFRIFTSPSSLFFLLL